MLRQVNFLVFHFLQAPRTTKVGWHGQLILESPRSAQLRERHLILLEHAPCDLNATMVPGKQNRGQTQRARCTDVCIAQAWQMPYEIGHDAQTQ